MEFNIVSIINGMYDYDLYKKLMNISQSLKDDELYGLFENYNNDDLVYIIKNYNYYDLDNIDLVSLNEDQILNVIDTLIDLYKFYLFRIEMLEDVEIDYFSEFHEMLYDETGKYLFEQNRDELIESLKYTYMYLHNFMKY